MNDTFKKWGSSPLHLGLLTAVPLSKFTYADSNSAELYCRLKLCASEAKSGKRTPKIGLNTFPLNTFSPTPRR